MAKQSSQKFIARNRAPRVQIEYDLELYGAEKSINLPFVMGVMADLSGKPAEALEGVADRKFLQIDVDNFDERMKAMKPRAAPIPVEDAEAVLEGEEPAAPPALVEARQSGATLDDEERRKAFPRRLHHRVLMPGDARHLELLGRRAGRPEGRAATRPRSAGRSRRRTRRRA